MTPLKGKAKEQLRSVVMAVKSLPKFTREAMFAERMGLCYMQNGETAYDSNHWIRGDAYFIGSDGKEHDFWKEVNAYGTSNWQGMLDRISPLGVQTVFNAFAAEITKIIHKNAAFHMKTIPAPLRDAWLAQMGGLLFLPDGSSAYTGKDALLTHDYGIRVRYDAYDENEAAFADSQGNVYLRHNDEKLTPTWHIWENRFNTLSLCAQHVGIKEIVGQYNKEMAALRKARSKALADKSLAKNLRARIAEVQESGLTEPDKTKATIITEHGADPDAKPTHTLMGDTVITP